MKLLMLLLLPVITLAASWEKPLEEKIKKIDQGFPGAIGVSIESLSDDSTLEYHADRSWYLSSTTKVFVAIAILKEVEKGHLSLSKKLTLKQSDFVDGAGSLLRQKPGSTFAIDYLIEQMMAHSDSTATDMLIRLLGEEKLNSYVQELAPGSGKFTTILQVRYDAYSELHEKARSLKNTDFIALKRVPPAKRAQAFADKIKVPTSELKLTNLDEAFEAYYRKGLNSSSLKNFVQVLTRLEKGELLNSENTARLKNHMENMKTGEARLKKGLGEGYIFSQKTGTQVRRMCNVGVITHLSTRKKSSVAVCAEKFTDPKAAERAFQEVGRALRESSGLL